MNAIGDEPVDDCDVSRTWLLVCWVFAVAACMVVATISTLKNRQQPAPVEIDAPALDCAQAAVIASIIADGRSRGMAEDIAAAIIDDRLQGEFDFVVGVVYAAPPTVPAWVNAQNAVSKCHAMNGVWLR